jgi:tetrapyrrole methylase family protein/MazG family protein
LSLPKDLSQFKTLVNIFARLRAPNGCPWDRKQTHASLRENLLEECYETLETLDEGDSKKLCEELGDLLMQIVFHAQIAAEAGEFDIGDVIKGINTKLIRRHPHIFSSAKAESAEEVAHNWEELKREEREAGTSMLTSLPTQMPALSYSQAIQRRAAQVGFDWKEAEDVIEKLVEEIKELRQADTHEEKEQEFADLLFTLVNIARRMGIESESALREANRRFYQRFTYMEELCRQRGLNLSKLSLGELDALWEEAKKGLKK